MSDSDRKFAQAILDRVLEMRRKVVHATSAEVAVYCGLIARAKGATPADLKRSLGTEILELLADLEVFRVFERADLRSGVEELGMTFDDLVRILNRREGEAAARKKKPVEA